MSERPSQYPANYRIEDRGDYLYVSTTGTIESEAMMRAYHQDVEAAMTPELRNRVLFDNREATQFDEALRAEMWTWVSSTPVIRRAALVAHGAKVKRRAQRTAELNRVRVLTFDKLEDAEAWLRTTNLGPA